MDIKKLLEYIDEDKCLQLFTRGIKTPAIIDKDDEFDTIDDEKCVLIRHRSETSPVPVNVFHKVVVINKFELMFDTIDMFMR